MAELAAWERALLVGTTSAMELQSAKLRVSAKRLVIMSDTETWEHETGGSRSHLDFELSWAPWLGAGNMALISRHIILVK